MAELSRHQIRAISYADLVSQVVNVLIKIVHDRMPVILTEEIEALWLDPFSSLPSFIGSVARDTVEGSLAMKVYERRGEWHHITADFVQL